MEIRKILTISELEKVQQLEKDIWGISPIPIHQTLTAVKNGGIVVGAFENGELVGFSYGFPGFKNGKPYLCSHQLGIAKYCRTKGIGEALKQEQRKVAIQYGYDRMLWTYDPLETRNGYLNLTKLRAICNTYIENCYGDMQDGFNKGLPSDRFEVNWYLTSSYIEQEQLVDTSNAIMLTNIKMDRKGWPVLEDFCFHQQLDERTYLQPVPSDFQQLKTSDPTLALDWRYKTRKVFQTLFSQGYVATHLEKGEKIHNYVFVKKENISI